MGFKADELAQAIATALSAVRRAHITARETDEECAERTELSAARAACARAAQEYCNRTGFDLDYFERALTDEFLHMEETLKALLDDVRRFSDALDGQFPELVRVQAKKLLLDTVRLARSWCAGRQIRPAGLDPRLDDPEFCK